MAIFRRFFRTGSNRLEKRAYRELDPDEILIDAHNVSKFDTHQFEGRLEKPIGRPTLIILGVFSFVLILVFVGRAWYMQVSRGEAYYDRSQNNILRTVPVFAGRGVIYDRNGNLLAWNTPRTVTPQKTDDLSSSSLSAITTSDNIFVEEPVARREYASSSGLSHVLGYVQYPSKDRNGFYYQEDFEGISGVELYYNNMLQGKNGSRMIEVNARNQIISHNTIKPPIPGESLYLTIDSRVQSALYNNIKDIAERVGFEGGAGIIMDIYSGEVIAMTSYPEFDSQLMSDKDNTEKITRDLNDKRSFFLNRAVDGLYVPGSIIKPYMAVAALAEKIIEPSTIIHTTGSINIPNPYDTTKSSTFRDWKNHGSVDMRRAIAVSSDVYFYIIGGGYKDQKGLGITKIDQYLKLFGFGEKISPSFLSGATGTIPTPEWKRRVFGEPWYLGNTYHTSIGQYGFLVTPIQMVRAVASLVNGGDLLVPAIKKGEMIKKDGNTGISDGILKVAREGMRLSVTEGTVKGLNVPYVKIAGKSGTAELGISKEKVNSWITGYWPYDNPKYAFAVILEKGSVHNLIGAVAASRQLFDWMNENTPEYFK